MASWLKRWEPENHDFWESTGKKIAWRTLNITTVSLTLSFMAWFLMSVVVVRLPQIGFAFSKTQLFWLAAMPGLAGGTLRIIHMFLIPIYGTRKVISIATFLKILPLVMLIYAINEPTTSFTFFIITALLLGMGGGDFSSFMPSTSTFFPKRLQGTALGIQAGVGNFGVSVIQFLFPWLMGIAIFGGLGASQVVKIAGKPEKSIFMQNVMYLIVVLLLIVGVWAWIKLRSIPIKASFKEQFDIFKNKHTWYCTLTYVMTFGTFSGLSAAFPMLIKTVYGGFPDAPDPLKYAFYGPLIGSLVRVLFGPVADKVGGAILTQITGIALIICCGLLIAMGLLAPTSMDQFTMFLVIMFIMFFFSGVGNAATFRQYPIIFSDSPRRAAGVIGFTAAIAAYGPFLFNVFIDQSQQSTGNANAFFIGLLILCVFATIINWWYYSRKGCEKPS